MRILVIGATGFIGRRLTSRLLKNGDEVHALQRYVTGRYSFENEIITHYANLNDYSAIRDIVKDIRPEIVVHLAAISAVSFSYNHPIEVSEVNYLGSVNLAEACRKEATEMQQFITAGTSEEYGMTLTNSKETLTEESPLEPNSPYAVAKVAFSYYLRYMNKAYDFPFTEMRPFNTYGREDNKHFFIERVITEMLRNKKCIYLGDRNAIRTWLYAEDHVEGYMKAIGNKKAIGEVFNLSNDEIFTTEQTAEIIAKMMDYKGKIIWHSTPKRPLDAKILIGDNTKAKKILGWKPRYTLEEGLKKTIDYWVKT